MKKFFAMIAIASVVMVSCNNAEEAKKEEVKPVETVTPPATDTASKPAMDTTKPAATDTTKKK
jgi:PBP1b-binding outer membrane lipoprotein LpoB